MTCTARTSIVFAGLGLLWLALPAGCAMPLHTATETLTEVFKTSDAPKIVIETYNGSIDISNGDADEVVVEVTKRASGFDEGSAAANLEHVEVEMAHEDNEVRIKVRRRSPMMGDSGANVAVAAPPNSIVELVTSNGYIVSEGMRAGVTAHSSNGKIDIVEASGPIEVETSNGPIQLEASDAVVEAVTSNARIRFKGTLAKGEHQLETSNGKIDVILPADSAFRFDAETSNGDVDCEFPFDRTSSSRGKRELSGVVGEHPQVELNLETSNSDIDIRRID